MIIKAHAKISLAINVIKKVESEDYHYVDNLSIPIELHDVIKITKIQGSKFSYLICDDPTLICDETEHAFAAFKMMKEAFKPQEGYLFQIYKRIPSKSGLGGGTADAAAIIKGFCKVFKIDINDPKVIEIASKSGKNTSFFLEGNAPARLTQEGNDVLFLDDLNFDYYVLIVKPDSEGIEAKKVFGNFDKLDESEQIHPNIDALIEAIRDGYEEEIGNYMQSSLLIPAIQEDERIQGILDIMHENGIVLSSVSGTGNACFGLSKDKKQLKRLEKLFKNQYGYPTLITSTRLKK